MKLLLLLLQMSMLFALRNRLRVKNDARRLFPIEDFGFTDNGGIELTIKNWQLDGKPLSGENATIAGFYIRISNTELIRGPRNDVCLLSQPEEGSLAPVFATPGQLSKNLTIDVRRAGLYTVFFVNCAPKGTRTTFELEMAMFNLEGNTRNYLSVGDSPLPWLYALLVLAWLGLLLTWVFKFLSKSQNVRLVHHLMSAVVVTKIFQLFFHAVSLHITRAVGNAGGWGVVYLVITGLKGLILFTAIALLGSGWTVMKAYLSENDKKIVAVVIPLQVIANVALAVTTEDVPGSQKFSSWYLTLQLVDIMCCLAVLVPIIWSIRHLRQASALSEKTEKNLRNLTLFRQFYVVVLAWIYFTRIMVDLLYASVPYRFLFSGELMSELATLLFACWTGWNFRPHNPFWTDHEA